MKNKILIAISSLFLIVAATFGVGAAFGGSKPSITYVYSNHCRACVVFERNVLQNKTVRQELSRFNYKKVNASTGEVSVYVTPTVIIYNKHHKIVRKFVPPQSPEEFLDIIRNVE